jgi:putative oxidoreductase
VRTSERYGTLAARVALAVFLVPVTAIFHNPAGLAGMEAQTQVIQVLKNLAIIGGLLSVASWGAGALSLEVRSTKQIAGGRDHVGTAA